MKSNEGKEVLGSSYAATAGMGDSLCWCSSFRFRRIGQGSSAVVYQAHDENNYPLQFAIKVFNSAHRADCEKEHNILKDLQHENIVECLGKPRHVENCSFLVLEMMEKGSLQAKRPVTIEQAKSYTRQILRALAYIHERGIMHGDVKLSNILIGRNDRCKLADFAQAKKLDGGEELESGKGPVLRSPAPEVLEEGGTYACPVDIYMLGCALRELLREELDIHDQSVETRRFLELCLQKDPKLRATAVELLEHDYLRSLDGCSDTDSDCPFPYEDQFKVETPPSFMDATIVSMGLDAIHKAHEDSCCLKKASSGVEPAGGCYTGSLKTVQQLFPTVSFSRAVAAAAPGNCCTSECKFLRLEAKEGAKAPLFIF